MRYAPVLLLLLVAAAPDGQQIALHGNNNGALPCAACHGVRGQGNPAMGAPALAGLPAGVIAAALAQYKAGNGGTALMRSIARALSPAQTQAVAAYFSALPHP